MLYLSKQHNKSQSFLKKAAKREDSKFEKIELNKEPKVQTKKVTKLVQQVSKIDDHERPEIGTQSSNSDLEIP